MEMKLTLAAGMDSFLRAMNMLRKRGVEVLAATYAETEASFYVLAEDVRKAQTNLDKLADVKVLA